MFILYICSLLFSFFFFLFLNGWLFISITLKEVHENIKKAECIINHNFYVHVCCSPYKYSSALDELSQVMFKFTHQYIFIQLIKVGRI